MDSISYKTIIIDDEQPAIQRLIDLFKHFPDTIQVIGQAKNGKSAIDLITNLNPDLIFLDVQMPGMNGFEMLQHLDKIPIIVFCTAYDQYSFKAFETNSIDYLLKPVKLDRLEQTIAKLNFFKQDFDTKRIMALLKNISNNSSHKLMSSITIRNGNKLVFVKLEDITYFKASDKYVSLYNKKGEEKVSELSLVQLEQKLPEYFLRIHRSLILNTQFVKEVQTYFNSRYSILLNDTNNTKLISGRSYQNQIKKWIGLVNL
jgi:two-component system, LytTR family, response regulator